MFTFQNKVHLLSKTTHTKGSEKRSNDNGRQKGEGKDTQHFTKKKDKESLLVSYKEVKKVKSMHKPLYLLLSTNVCSMSSQLPPSHSLGLEKLL